MHSSDSFDSIYNEFSGSTGKMAAEITSLRAQLAALQREHAASAARVVALEALNSQAARLLRDYAGDAHDEDVPDVQRWLAVYESRQKREALAQPDAARPAGERE
jgi:uncharacterized protein YukE